MCTYLCMHPQYCRFPFVGLFDTSSTPGCDQVTRIATYSGINPDLRVQVLTHAQRARRLNAEPNIVPYIHCSGARGAGILCGRCRADDA